LTNQGIFTSQELFEELLSLADESKLLKFVNQRSTGSDLDKQKLQEKLRTSLNRLRRLGMVHFLQNDSSKFIISESVFRFGADVRSGDNPQDAQLRMIRDGEAISLDGELSLKDSDEDEVEDSQDPAESDEDEE
jgi:chromosome partition protein MukE